MVKLQKDAQLLYDVPLDSLVKAARSITGWKVASIQTKPNAENCLVTKFRFAHRGGMIFPVRTLEQVEGVSHVHHFVLKGIATVWVTWKPELAQA